MKQRLILLFGLSFVFLVMVDTGRREERNAGPLFVEQAGSHKPVNRLSQIVTHWLNELSRFDTLNCEIDETVEDGVFETTQRHRRIVRLMRVGGSGLQISSEYQTRENTNEDGPWRTVEKHVLGPDRQLVLDHHSKTAYARTLQQGSDLDAKELSNFAFPLVAFSGLKEDELLERFQVNIVQQDKDWTWVRFIPLDKRDQWQLHIGQIGVVNYRNQRSPAFFPLAIQWRDPGNATHRWSVRELHIDEPGWVTAKDFQLDEDYLARAGWTVHVTTPVGAMVRWRYTPSDH